MVNRIRFLYWFDCSYQPEGFVLDTLETVDLKFKS